MTKIDQFESVFKAAAKSLFQYETVAIESVLVVSDKTGDQHEAFANQTKDFLRVLDETTTWHDIQGDGYSNVQQLLDAVNQHAPDIICTYRNLQSSAWQWPYSLGKYLDVLTQQTNIPILVLPHPNKEGKDWPSEELREVMAVTDHLTGDDRLINYAVRFTPRDGTLFMSHVEDQETFDRYVELFSKIPEIDTDIAREKVLEQLLKEPNDYIESCRDALNQEGRAIEVAAIVTMGHFLSDYQQHIQEQEIDLLVLNTKDDDQLAMHGLAYPLAVELRTLPLLML
jgi:hypothetical protein